MTRENVAGSTLSTAEKNRAAGIAVGAAVACQLLLLIVVGWRNRQMINPDATAYVLLAGHYLKGELGLAISGYWGPLLTWLIVPLLPVVSDPLLAARIAMGLSALVFQFGSISVFQSLQLPLIGIVLASWITAIASVFWSVENITPDLLVGGLLCLAISGMISPRWVVSRRVQLLAGLLFGAAYLAKSVAFPVSVGLCFAIGSMTILIGSATPRMVLRSVAVTFLGLVLVAAPWITILSAKYGTFVISRSARAAHVLVGPPDLKRVERNTFQRPEAGRISSGEDRTFVEHWSPLDSPERFKYQLWLMFQNAKQVATFLAGFDRLHLGLVAVLLAMVAHRPWRENLATQRWRWAGLPIACLSAIYFPVYAAEERYYYPTYPFLVAASLGLMAWLTRTARARMNVFQGFGVVLIVVSFIYGPARQLPEAVRGLNQSVGAVSKDLADKLDSFRLEGAIAAAGDCNGRTGQSAHYVAFFKNQPFYGCEAMPTQDRIKNSGASLILVDRRLTSLIAEMEDDPFFKNMDASLFNSREEASTYPVTVYRTQMSGGT